MTENPVATKRCVNIDWLECFCLEDYIGYPHDATYFRSQGFHVEQREYGTRVYEEMFTVFGRDDQPLLEVRRKPKSGSRVLPEGSCHVRLVNRTCYFANPALLLQQFLERYFLHYQRISRIDICLDFEKFDSGDYPQKFIRRYMKGKYAKINQANISSYGKDAWTGREWNSLKWGAPTSMVTTRIYNKTQELREAHDKPYIRQAWRAAGLVDDEFELTKRAADGTIYKPDIWRVEFAVKSGTKGWFVMEDNNGQKKHIRSVRNDLNVYQSKQQVLDVFFSLCDCYFHFKQYDKKVRKDRCIDKILFDYHDRASYYKLNTTVATNEQPDAKINRLKALLEHYKETHASNDIYNACNVLIRQLEFERRSSSIVRPWPLQEIQALRMLIAKRIKDSSAPLTQDIAQVNALINIYDDTFSGIDSR